MDQLALLSSTYQRLGGSGPALRPHLLMHGLNLVERSTALCDCGGNAQVAQPQAHHRSCVLGLLLRIVAVGTDDVIACIQQGITPLTTAVTQQAVVSRAVAQVLQSEGAKGNILSLGFRFRRQGTNNGLTSCASIENYFPNSVVTHITRPEWRKLLTIMGAPAMTTLLSECSLFESLPNGCFLQLSGPPLSSLAMSHHRSLNHTRQATPGLPTLIQRVGLYYARTFHRRAGLPAAHTLSQATIAWKFAKSTRERRAAAHALMTSVFHVDVGNMCSRLKKATPVFLSFLHRHSVCDYQRLLSRHCPLKPYSASQDGVEDVMSHAVPHSAVSGFVRAVLRAVIPKGLLGSFEVESVLFKRVSQFVSQQRGDVMRPCDILSGISVSAFLWAGSGTSGHRCPSDTQKQTLLVQQWLMWLFNTFILALLRCHFYVTDSETYKSRTLYFRKAFWARATGAAIARLTHVLKLKPLTSAQLGAVMDKPDRVLATANVRFVPKRNGIRPVVNLSARPLQNKQSEGAKAPRSAPTATQTQATSTSAPPLKRSRTMESQAPPIDAKSVTKPPAMNSHPKTGPVLSVNGALSGVHDVLRFEYDENRDVLGAAVLGLDDVYLKLRQFHGALRTNGRVHPPALYFVAADVQSCFDTIQQGKLCEIIAPVVAPDYVVQKFSTVQAPRPLRGAKRNAPDDAPKSVSSLTAPRVQFCKKACRPEDQAPFPDTAAAAAAERRKPVVFCDGVVYPSLDRSKCLQLLRQHVCEHVVTIRGQPYLQGGGIPQGSVVSTALCNYYYGKLETGGGDLAKYAGPPPPDAHSLLMRLTDDYLFVTTDRQLASEFAGTLHRGFVEYNCRVNPAKTVVNFEMTAVNAAGETIVVPQTRSGFLPWCGLLLDVRTLDVCANYSRYCAPYRVADSVTVPAHAGRGYDDLLNLYKGYFRPKCHAIMLDGSINSVAAVAVNVSRMSCLATAKLICLLKKPQFSCFCCKDIVLRLTLEGFEYLTSFIRFKMESSSVVHIIMKAGSDGLPKPCCPLSSKEVRWIASKSSQAVYRHKSAKPLYRDVTSSLQFDQKYVVNNKLVRQEVMRAVCRRATAEFVSQLSF